MNDAERFEAKWTPEPNTGCWLWTGVAIPSGYGQFIIGSRTDGTRRKVYAHRWSYEHSVGPIPEGLQIDHLCRVPGCVNPGHLEPVTPSENIRRGHEARGTTAQHGTNSMYTNNGCRSRPCRAAGSAYHRERYARKRAEGAAAMP